MLPSETTLLVVPEGPVAHDGTRYRYSKGERLYLDRLAKRFKSVHIAAFVFRNGHPDYDGCSHSAFESPNISVHELPWPSSDSPGRLSKIIQYAHVFARIFGAVRSTDAVYLFLPAYTSLVTWVWSRILGRPHFVYAADDWEAASFEMYKWEDRGRSVQFRLFFHLNRWFERRIASTALFSVVAGRQLLEKYREFGKPVYETVPRIALTPNVLYDRPTFECSSTPLLLHVGSLQPGKSQAMLFRAFAVVLEEIPKARLRLIGSGPDRGMLEKLAVELRIADRVEFAGYVREEKELYAHFREADLFVLSSRSEGFPRVLYEAMALSLPIVSTDCGGIPYLLQDGRDALLVKVGDERNFASSVVRAVRDTSLRRTLMRSERRIIESVFSRLEDDQIARLIYFHSSREETRGERMFKQTEKPDQMFSQDTHTIIEHRYRYAASLALNARVLEVGCGSGIGLPLLAKQASTCVGADFSAENLAIAAKTRVPVVRLNAESLPFSDGAFDLVVCLAMVYYLDLPKFLIEARRVLASNGTLFFCTSNMSVPGFVPAPFTTRYYSVPELDALLSDAGFTARFHGAFPVARSYTSQLVYASIKRAAKWAAMLFPAGKRAWEAAREVKQGVLKPLPVSLPHEYIVPVAEPSKLNRHSADLSHRVIYTIAVPTKR